MFRVSLHWLKVKYKRKTTNNLLRFTFAQWKQTNVFKTDNEIEDLSLIVSIIIAGRTRRFQGYTEIPLHR